ncbi:DNA adenine methylase [Paraburkholderia xenovorans]|uniref:DNA adenine methylase n=1 Tax=Paraburkholderia xenovorans TaxID=36873 RepID=UPI0038B6E05B
MAITNLNPLRYPGSKGRSLDFFANVVRESGFNGRQIVEPYAGSASVSLGLLEKGLVSSVMLFERDPLVFAFWYSAFFRTQELLESIRTVDVSLDTWKALDVYRQYETVPEDQIVQCGLAGLFFNRTNFSGVIHAGPIGGQSQSSAYGIGCRFNKVDLMKRVEAVAELGSNVEVYFGDALQALKDASLVQNDDRFFYIDPPYYTQGKKLYRYHYQFSDHENLAAVLAAANYDWVLSYDAHSVIEFLYDGMNQYRRSFRYSSRVQKVEEELLISNAALSGVEEGTQLVLFDEVDVPEVDALLENAVAAA